MAPSIFRRLFAQRAKERVSGRPSSSNGASSSHLFWDVPPEPLRSVAVTLTVEEPPVTPELYFWALQVTFLEDGRQAGAGHLGLQHHPSYPGSTAANWGGYDRHGGELGGRLLLPSSLSNPNTCDFTWTPRTPYRLRVGPSPSQGWRGSITDLSTNSEVILRDLEGRGAALGSPMVWSEVFADCGSPSTAVQWSDPTVETISGYLIHVTKARVSYQSETDGGCSNTTVVAEGAGLVQRTAASRVVWPETTVSF